MCEVYCKRGQLERAGQVQWGLLLLLIIRGREGLWLTTCWLAGCWCEREELQRRWRSKTFFFAVAHFGWDEKVCENSSGGRGRKRAALGSVAKECSLGVNLRSLRLSRDEMCAYSVVLTVPHTAIRIGMCMILENLIPRPLLSIRIRIQGPCISGKNILIVKSNTRDCCMYQSPLLHVTAALGQVCHAARVPGQQTSVTHSAD